MTSARNFYAYNSDDGTTYQVGLSDDNAVAGGFGGPIADGAAPGFPVGWRMRHVSAAFGFVRTRIPIASNSDPHYTTGGAVTKGVTSYSIGGRIGERMTSKK